MLIRENGFRGQIPALAPQYLPEGAAQVSKNAVHDNGNLRPLKDTAFVVTPAKAGVKKSIHLFAGQFWFHWLAAVDAVRAPIPNDTMERTVFTGDGVPKVTDASIATAGGGALYPNNSYLLGIPAPTSAPTVATTAITWAGTTAYALGKTVVVGDYLYRVTIAGTSGGSAPAWPTTVAATVADGTVTWTCEAAVSTGDTETTAYVETFVRRWSSIDEEGPPSPASNPIDVQFVNGQAVNVSALNAAPVGGYNITHRRLYRINTASDSAFQFVAEQAIADIDTTDAILSADLGEVLATEDYSLPPDDLAGIRAMPNGVLVGFSGKNVCFCEPYQCHAWPTRYRLAADYPIVGVEVFGSSVLVTTEGVPYVATGAQPGYMTMDRTEINQACVSRRGMADLGSAVAYPSPDGLMMIGSGVAEIATRQLFRRADWQALKPSSFVAAAHNGKYYAFYDTGAAQGCLILDLADGSVDFADIHATAVHVDLLTDTLYLQRGDDIVAWDAGNALTLTRLGKRHDLPRPANFGAAQVKATAYPCTFKLYADGVLKHTQTVISSRPFRLPGGYRCDKVENELSGSVGEIEALLVAETLSELRQV
jgi:hypothetical protein